MLLGFPQILRSISEVSTLAGNHAHVPKDFAAPRRRIVAVNGEEFLALRESFVEPPGSYIELNFVDGEIELTGAIAFFFERLGRQVVRGLGVIELAELHIGERDVVEYLGFVVPHSEGLITEMTQAKRLERGTEITADNCDGAQVLIDHGDESTIAGQLRLRAGCLIDRGSLIEIPADLIDDTDDVERLCNRWRGANDIR